jgi:LCP family protein required for cell wall assembly
MIQNTKTSLSRMTSSTERRRLSRMRFRRRNPYRACLFPILLFISLVGALALGGYALWSWSATLPRANVLILGLDRRPEEGNVVRSDTMILASVSPSDSRIALLSIPRDLYVEIPGHDPDRINTAHFWGENDADGNGPALAMQTVEQNFNVPVHHYVRVDFDGFRAVVNAVGGIDIVVEEAIVDDQYPTADYGVIRIEIPAGPQRMDGETALRYARSRHGSSDFDRIKRQQQVIAALAQRLLKPGVWLRLPLLYLAVTDHVETDLTDRDMLLLLPTLYRAGTDGIERHTIDREMTLSWTTPAGGAVLLPQWEMIRPRLQEWFTP